MHQLATSTDADAQSAMHEQHTTLNLPVLLLVLVLVHNDPDYDDLTKPCPGNPRQMSIPRAWHVQPCVN